MKTRILLSIVLVVSGLPVSAQGRGPYVPNFLPPGMSQRPAPLVLPPLGFGSGFRPAPPSILPYRPGGPMGGFGAPSFYRPRKPSLLSSLAPLLGPLLSAFLGGGNMGFGQPAYGMGYNPGLGFNSSPLQFNTTPRPAPPVVAGPAARMAQSPQLRTQPQTQTQPPVVSNPPPETELNSTEASSSGLCVNCDNGAQAAKTGSLAKIASALDCGSEDTDVCNMFAGVNEMRREANRPAYKYDPTCQAAAEVHGRDMASQGFFQHPGSDGSSVYSRYQRVSQGARIRAVGENLYMETGDSADGAARGNAQLKNSPGHYSNIISPNFTHIGIARVQGNCPANEARLSNVCTYYVQCFSRPAAQ